MFLILVNYKKSIEEIDQHLTEHRAYLDEGYRKNYLITSGPRNPRSGGVILSQLKDRKEIDTFLAADPFSIHHLVEYEVIEFTPVKYHAQFKHFIE